MSKNIQIGVLIGQRYIRNRKLLREENPFFIDFPKFLKGKGIETLYFSPDRLPEKMPSFVYKAFNKYFSPKELKLMPSFYAPVKEGKVFLINSLPFLRATGDKMVLHEILSEDSRINKILPHTLKLSAVDSARELKEKYADYLIKPAKGADGVDIHRVGRINMRQAGFYLRNSKKYILQEMVESPLFRKRVFDLRIGMIKKGSGFRVFYEYARIGAKGDFRSNISQGGSIVFSDKFDSLFNKKQHEVMVRAAARIASLIEKKTGYANICCADFMIDTQGEIYFIEANSAPGWHFLYELKKADRFKVFSSLFGTLKEFLDQIESGKK